MTAIFVSHRSSDNADAEALKKWLAAQGHERLFLDFDPADGIPAGVDWEQRLYQELRRCQALLLVLTPAWLESKWCGNELAIAREKGKAVFVVRVKPCADGPLIPAIQEVDLTTDRDVGLEKLARGLGEHGLDPRDAFDWKPDRPIYPGLAAFDVDDAAIFFGRSEESWQTIEALRRMRLQATGSPKLLLITGASGSGKSSLMRAGMLARLRKEPASWIAARPFRRGADALGALAEALAWAFPPDRRPTSLEAITARLAGPDGAGQLLALARELRLALDRPEATLVLALDQAEELLAAERADDAAKLLDLLRTTLAAVGNEILVLATIRSDRLGAWQQHASIKATADHGELPFEMLPLGPMPMARIGDIVRGPAAYEGLQIDDELVDAIRADTVSPDALPLLAYTLQYLHRHFADDGRLTLVEYRSFGGLEGSVRSQADAAIPIERLSEEDRRALHEAFVPGLVRATAEGGFSRSRALLATLPPRAEPHLRRLIDEARLLTTGSDPEGGVTVEVAHESLLRVWPTLARWIAEDTQSLRRLEAMQRAAQDWAHAGRGEEFLVHRDHRLSDAEALTAEPRFVARLESADRDYLTACRNAQNQREADKREAQERELRAARELANRRLLLVYGAMAASILLIGVAVVAWWQWDKAEATATRLADINAQLRSSRSLRFTTAPDEVASVGPNWYYVASLNATGSVAIVYSESQQQIGSGFLAKGELFRSQWMGKTILVTSAHVIGKSGPSIAPNQARFIIPAIANGMIYPIGETLFVSASLHGLSVFEINTELPRNVALVEALVDPTFIDRVQDIQDLDSESRKNAGAHLSDRNQERKIATISYGIFVENKDPIFGLSLSVIIGKGIDHSRDNRMTIYRQKDSLAGASGAPVYDAESGGLICVHSGGSRIPVPVAGSFCSWIYDELKEMDSQ